MKPSYRLKNVLTGQTYHLSQPASVIGRNHHCEIQIDSVALSRNHASLHLTEHGVVVEDLNSTNGTYVNNIRVHSPTLLSDGDVVAIGNHRLLFIEPTVQPRPQIKEPALNILSSPLVAELSLLESNTRESNRTMIHSSFARSMGGLPVDEVFGSESEAALEQVVLNTLQDQSFDPRRVPAVLIVKNSRKRGVLIQLKVPHGGSCEWAIGRSQLADVVIDDPTVSNLHAVIALTQGEWVLCDNDSTNGVKINGEPQQQGTCRHGDTLTVGGIELLFYVLRVRG